MRKESADNKEQAEIFISKEWFSKTLQGKDDAFILTDLKGDVTDMNKLAEELTGWKLNESRGISIENIFDAINEETQLPIDNPINIALKQNRATLLANHTILIKRDKTQRIIVDSAVPIHNNKSEVIGGALIFKDVTVQSDSKKKLDETEGLLKGIMGNTTLIIYIKDLEGKYLFINQQKEKVYNIKSADVIGKDSIDHLTEKEAEISKRTDKQAIEKEKIVEYEHEIKHADGTTHYYHTSKFPLCNGEKNIYAICAVSTDITASKKNIEMKEQLAQQNIVLKSEMRYNELTQNMPQLFFSLNSSFRYTSFNKACEKFTGKKASQVIGKTIDEIYPGGAPPFFKECEKVAGTGLAKSFVSSFDIDGNSFTYQINIYPLERGISVLMTDITLQKKIENDTLDIVEHLQEKNKDLRQFAYAMTHDLRAPIAKVLGLLELAVIHPDLKIKNKTVLENVASEITDLDTVMKDMISTITDRSKDKFLEYVAFEDELILIMKVLENEITESKVLITCDFKKAKGTVTVKSYLYSIMYNLLSNAIKYRMPDVPLTVHFKTSNDNGFICLSVKDNGKGIDLKKNGDKVFGLFNRFHIGTIEGKGIGLNLVKSQVESLGGKIKLESEVNNGSTFRIYLPVNQKPNATS